MFPNIKSVQLYKLPVLNHFIKSFSKHLKFLKKLSISINLSRREALLIGRDLKSVEGFELFGIDYEENDLKQIYENLKIKKLHAICRILKGHNFEFLN